MKSTLNIILILCFAITSCKKSSEKTNNSQIDNGISQEKVIDNNSNDLDNNKEFKIDVLGLNIGDTIPEKIDGYKLVKSVKVVEEGQEQPIIKVIENGNELIQISPAFDIENQKFNNKIGEILIFSDQFKTNENIGVNSTIEDFISAYPNYHIWYTYITDNYIIENEHKNVQFLLDEKNYIGKEDLYESDMIELKKEDFAKNSKIKAIRIF